VVFTAVHARASAKGVSIVCTGLSDAVSAAAASGVLPAEIGEEGDGGPATGGAAGALHATIRSTAVDNLTLTLRC
jgi:hypothetical protein